VLAAAALFGCRKGTPLVPTGSAPPGDDEPGARVSSRPPATKVEVVPLQRDPDCRWQGGFWDFRGGSWSWVKGSWVHVPEGCFYVPPATHIERGAAGVTLVYRRGRWLPEGGGTKECAAARSCGAQSGEIARARGDAER
jgi:hypothetical protein